MTALQQLVSDIQSQTVTLSELRTKLHDRRQALQKVMESCDTDAALLQKADEVAGIINEMDVMICAIQLEGDTSEFAKRVRDLAVDDVCLDTHPRGDQPDRPEGTVIL